MKVSDWASVARLVALIAQADTGDYDSLSPPNALYSQCCQIQTAESCESRPQDFLHRIVQQHKEIKVCGYFSSRMFPRFSSSTQFVHAFSFFCRQAMKTSTAEYWLLKEISNLDTFGQEMFHSKFGYNGVSMIGVGPHGITVYRNHDEETQK